MRPRQLGTRETSFQRERNDGNLLPFVGGSMTVDGLNDREGDEGVRAVGHGFRRPPEAEKPMRGHRMTLCDDQGRCQSAIPVKEMHPVRPELPQLRRPPRESNAASRRVGVASAYQPSWIEEPSLPRGPLGGIPTGGRF